MSHHPMLPSPDRPHPGPKFQARRRRPVPVGTKSEKVLALRKLRDPERVPRHVWPTRSVTEERVLSKSARAAQRRMFPTPGAFGRHIDVQTSRSFIALRNPDWGAPPAEHYVLDGPYVKRREVSR